MAVTMALVYRSNNMMDDHVVHPQMHKDTQHYKEETKIGFALLALVLFILFVLFLTT